MLETRPIDINQSTTIPLRISSDSTSEIDVVVSNYSSFHAPHLSPAECQAFAQQVGNFFGDDTIDPALQFPPGPLPPGFNASLEFDSWSEVSQVCGDSRVWGGMHFAVSSITFFLIVIQKRTRLVGVAHSPHKSVHVCRLQALW